VILFGREWWTKLINWEYLRDEGVIAAEDLNLFRFVDTAKEAWDKIQDYYLKKGGGFGPLESRRPRRK
jgi:predicted Rossmann-fold nucleotide-binding protein